MRIGVFGDSFADRSPHNPDSPFKEDESWIKCIEDGGHKITTYGKTGTSSWWSYQQFLAHHDQFDHIVFMHSSLHRMHHLPDGLEGLHFLNTPDELYETRRNKELSLQQEIEMVRILTGHIINIDVEFDVWVKQKIFNDVNDICRNKEIKLVNVLTFEDRREKHLSTNLDVRAGVCLYNLISVSRTEIPDMGRVDNRWCHLSKERNMVFAKVVIDALELPYPEIIDLYKDPELNKKNKEITARYTVDLDKKED
jgi:hypothetical protein